MRHRNTKERRALREAFVQEHAATIKGLLTEDQTTVDGDGVDLVTFVENVARGALEYSPATSWLTIWYTLKLCYNRLFETDF